MNNWSKLRLLHSAESMSIHLSFGELKTLREPTTPPEQIIQNDESARVENISGPHFMRAGGL